MQWAQVLPLLLIRYMPPLPQCLQKCTPKHVRQNIYVHVGGVIGLGVGLNLGLGVITTEDFRGSFIGIIEFWGTVQLFFD